MTTDPLLGPFMTTKLTDYRDMPGYAISPAVLSDCCCSSAVAWTLAQMEGRTER